MRKAKNSVRLTYPHMTYRREDFMLRLFFAIWFMFVPFLVIYGQGNKTFEDELFTFNYPATFKPDQIKNSPGMKLKLISESYGLSVSYVDTGWDESVSVWDDRISERLYNNYSGNHQIVSTSKETIKIKGGERRCLKLMTNSQKFKQGVTYNLRHLSYMMLYKGKLFIVGFISNGKYTKTSSTAYPEKILKGFQFNGREKQEVDFDKYLLNLTKQLNSQCPMRIDQCTTHMNVVLAGKTLMIKTMIDDSCENLVDYDEFKKKMCENFSVALEKPFVQYLDRNGYTMTYMIYNEYDRLKKKITISGREILNYYH